jgi:hypothetical protein
MGRASHNPGNDDRRMSLDRPLRKPNAARSPRRIPGIRRRTRRTIDHAIQCRTLRSDAAL